MKSRLRLFGVSFGRVLLAVAMVAGLAAGTWQPVIAATQIDIAGPAGSGAFGTSVTVLPNGNIVVIDPYYDDGATADVGAVYLYDGATGAQISMLTGSTAGDRVGYVSDWEAGVRVLSSGNYLVLSRYWDNGTAADAGAVTWASRTAGVSGVVSAANSLVGSTADDMVGWDYMHDQRAVTELSNGNYLVLSTHWDNGTAQDAGAVTWGSGTTGVSGEVSAANSLVGSTQNDQVGCGSSQCVYGVAELSNGNYLVWSPYWDNGPTVDAGAVTWGSGTTGVKGVVSPANSLVGSTAGDRVGCLDEGMCYDFGVTELSNGNYVVNSPRWDNGPAGAADAGAVTWGSGMTGVKGAVSATNSLVGSTDDDQVGDWGVTVLSNGHYVVLSPDWDNGAVVDAGAATWGNGATGIAGPVSAANSLVGSTAGDQVGFDLYGSPGVTKLSNGNYYVVRSPLWDNGATVDAGAVTWGSGTTGVKGVVSAANSLVGSTAADHVGSGLVTTLSNGNYVMGSPYWDNGPVADAGAVTWANGTTGIIGPVSPANSLVGSTAGDWVGGVRALSNGNYLVVSYRWDNGAATDAGAVTWGSGTAGVKGVVSAANSLVGSAADDHVGCIDAHCGELGVMELSSGNYLVVSFLWDNGPAADAGAVTWGSGTTGVKGVVSAANSLVGSTAHDHIGCIDEYCEHSGVAELSNGNYLVRSRYWDNGTAVDAGAATWGSGTSSVSGVVSAANSLVGSTADDQVGYEVMELSNGNYVLSTANWSNGLGAVTWGSGTTGVNGVVSAANSLVGSTAGGPTGVTALSNGNYVVSSYYWDNGGATGAGAVTWANGTTGIVGVVSAANSLVGSTDDDQVGSVTALANGNYVVSSSGWDNGAVVDAGAVTWADGTTGIVGPVSPANSLVGSTADDRVGYSVTRLSNGNYLVYSPYWDNSLAGDAGAMTWGNGTTGIVGVVSAANSLVGSTAGDQVGFDLYGFPGVTELKNGNYVVESPLWDNGGIGDAGAVTWGDRTSGTAGPITVENSVRGTSAGGGTSMVWAYDEVNRQLVVGRPADNIVTLFGLPPVPPDFWVFLPVVLKNAP